MMHYRGRDADWLLGEETIERRNGSDADAGRTEHRRNEMLPGNEAAMLASAEPAIVIAGKSPEQFTAVWRSFVSV
jgi:hypothetical protein